MRKIIDSIISWLLIFIYVTGIISLFTFKEYDIQFITILIYVMTISYKLTEALIGLYKNKKK